MTNNSSATALLSFVLLNLIFGSNFKGKNNFNLEGKIDGIFKS